MSCPSGHIKAPWGKRSILQNLGGGGYDVLNGDTHLVNYVPSRSLICCLVSSGIILL